MIKETISIPNNKRLNNGRRRYVLAAISHAQLLTVSNPNLEGDINITALVKNLTQALLLTENISLSINDTKDKQIDLDRIFNLSAHMVCIVSPKGYFLKVSPAFVEKLGFSETELLTKPFTDFIHPDEVVSTIDNISSLERGVPTKRFENRHMCKNDSLKWLEWTACCFVNGGNIYAIAHDITEYKKIEEDLSKLIILHKSLGVQYLTDHTHLNSDIKFITNITNIVLANLTDSDFHVDALAENVFMSRSTLQRKIKIESGVSAAQFIRQVRLARAHDFIVNQTHTTLTETAHAVGFKHIGNFSKVYKKYAIEIGNVNSRLLQNNPLL